MIQLPILRLAAHQALHADVAEFFEDARQREFAGVAHQYTETLEKDHGRIEKRRYWLVDAIDWLVARHDWVGLHSISMIERIRQVGQTVTREVSYTINSLTGSVAKWHGRRGHIGGSRTAFITCWMSPSTRMTAGSARRTSPRTWPRRATSP